MKQRSKQEKPAFPPVRAEFAGELTPGLAHVPVSRAHERRFQRVTPAPEERPAPDDTGVRWFFRDV